MNPRLRFVAVLVATGAAWGSTQPLGKIAVSTGHGHFALIFWQLVIGALLLGAVLLVRRQGFAVTRARLAFAAMIAVIGTLVPNSTFYISVAQLPSGIMSIIIATVPLLSFPIAMALGMDRFGWLRVMGLLCGVAGVALIALPEASLPSPAMAAFLPLAMVGPLFYAVEGNVVARWGTWGMSAVQTMFLVSLVGAVMALPLAVLSGQWFDPFADWGRAETALVASSIAHALAYATYVWLAAQAGAVFAAQTGYIVTGTGVIWAMLLLGERFSPFVWAALGVMMLGLFLVQPRARPVLAV
ncbi:MAG TPA: DMT family transporter [Paracoccaceae bacterium]|nr:DMT family transporter [Paracoccaceae bacterium]